MDNKLFIMCFLVLCLVVGLIIYTKENVEYKIDLPCYDRDYHIIKGVSCDGYVGNTEITQSLMDTTPLLCLIGAICCLGMLISIAKK